ncbi:MAG: tetratricopeptide repeat protein, partial [Myxococcales bacterium]|nr:tetratricopeptide repeat protein [Myxococcales bacterium]
MVDVANTDEDQAGCYQRMAKLASDALDRELDSVDLWGRVLDLRGEDPLALTELANLHEKAQRWDDLVSILERMVYVIEDPQERVDAFQRLGRTQGEKLENDIQALEAWISALDIDPENLETLETLKRLYEESQAWVELIDILSRMVQLPHGVLAAERLRDLWAQIGQIQGEYLMATDEAIAAWLQVLAIAEGDMEALAALEELYTTEGRWEESIQILERKAEVVEDEEGKIDVLMQVASIYEEKLQNKMQASGAYIEILDLRPGHPPAADALEAIYRETEQWDSLTELLITRAEVTDEDQVEDKVNYLQQAAKVFEEKQGDLDSAFAILQAAFNVDYANEDTSRELERIATIANKWGELLNEYNSIVNEIEDPLERCELWVKIGRWYGEHLDRPDYGIQSLHKALELNSESVNALRELSNFYRRAGQAAELAETLARIVPLEQEPEVQAATLLDLAQVQETGLGDLPASVESYRRVLEIDSESVIALDSLARLHEAQGQWNELVAVLDRRAQIMEDPDEILVIRKRIGWVQEVNLQDAAAAIETFKDITANEPTDRDALQALERLYMSQGNIDEYLETLEAELDATADVEEQIQIYDKMATALVDHSGDRERATEVLEKILELDYTRDETYRRLEELYFGLEKWTELVETYRNHVGAISDYGMKIALLQAMGETFEKQIQDLDRAIDCYREILELDANHFHAANTLSRLQEAIEDWPSAVETMDRLVQLNHDPHARLELLTRMGRVYFQKLEDQPEAERRLNDALTIEPGHVPALVILAEIYKARMDWLKAARTLQSASEYANNNYEKTNLAAEAGFIFLEELEDENSATRMFGLAIGIDPEHVKVGKVLSRVYFQAERYAEADPIFDMLARKSDQLELDDDDMRELYLRAAKVARKLGQGEKALKRYKSAYDIDSTNHEVLTGMADLLFEQENWDRAFKLYQTILVQHRDSQSDDDTVLVYYRLGTIKRRQNEPRKALNYMEKALEVQPFNRQVLEAVIELQSAANDWEGVIQAKRALVDVVESDEERFDLHKEIGALYVEKLDNRTKAAEAYMQALDLRPNDFPLLHTLLALYQENKQWDELISTIDRIVEIEKDPVRRSRYNYSAAVVLRDNLTAQDEAIDRFNTVLDDDPSYLKAFQAIDAVVTKNKDWKTLERSYRKMIKRLPATGSEELALALWSNLGEIYRTRLNNFQSAAEVFTIVATQFDPNNPKWQIILAELYERLLDDNPTEFAPKAVSAHQALIAQEPYRIESYHALYNIYTTSRQVDKAWCLAQALVFLKKATDEQQAFYDRYRQEGFVRARQRLSETTMRKHVFHPDQDAYLTGILGLVAQPLAAWRAKELPPTIKADSRTDITLDPSPFAQVAKYVKDVLNVSPPDCYLRPNEPGDITVLNVKRDGAVHPSMVVYQNILRGKKEHHLVFALGKHMMELYPPHYAYVTIDR